MSTSIQLKNKQQLNYTYSTYNITLTMHTLPAEAQLVSREDRRFPDKVLWMYPPFSLLHRLLVTLLQRLGDTDDMLPLVVLEQLEGCASANQNKHQVIRYRKFVLTYS